MARLFDDASTEYLQVEQAVLAGVPLAMICWFNKDEITSSCFLMGLADKDVDNQLISLYVYDTDPNQKLRASSNSAAASGYAVVTAAYSADTWHHACGIWADTDDRRVLLDGGSKGTNATDVTPANLDRTSIGRLGRATPGYYMSGMIAEAAIWDLTNWPGATASDKADEFERAVASLAKGFSPLCYPLGLVAYWPLIRGLNDKVGGYNLTANGTNVSNHPRIILPHSPL